MQYTTEIDLCSCFRGFKLSGHDCIYGKVGGVDKSLGRRK